MTQIHLKPGIATCVLCVICYQYFLKTPKFSLTANIVYRQLLGPYLLMCSEPTIPEGLSSLDQTLERYLGTCSRKEKKSLTKRLSLLKCSPTRIHRWPWETSLPMISKANRINSRTSEVYLYKPDCSRDSRTFNIRRHFYQQTRNTSFYDGYSVV